MAPKSHPVPVYEEHIGTIRISSHSNPPNCAAKAIKLMENPQVSHIDFLCVGKDAMYQAMLAMSLFRIFEEENTNKEFSLAFTPFHVYTMAEDRSSPHKPKWKMTATVWRMTLLESEQAKRLLTLNFAPTPTETP